MGAKASRQAQLRQCLTKALETAHALGTAPALSCAVMAPDFSITVHTGQHTYAPDSPEVSDDTLWDIASLTKVIGTFRCYELLAQGSPDFAQTPLGALLPCTGFPDKAALTLSDLMSHQAGFPGAIDYFVSAANKAQIVDAIMRTKLDYPAGTARVYDDASYILLGMALESHLSSDLRTIFHDMVFGPAEMTNTMFNPDFSRHPMCVPTEWVPALEQVAQGIVHDDNTRILGGFGGQAGLFSSSKDLLKFGRSYLRWQGQNPNPGLDITRPICADDGGLYTLGWDIHNPRTMPPSAGTDWISHTGFTGVMLSISFKFQAVVVLLSNRVFPKRTDSSKINHLRRHVLDTVITALSRSL